MFQPEATCGEDATVFSLWPNSNSGQHPDFIACAWTNQGNPSTARALVKFDLGVIPLNVTVLQATLYLFHYPSTSNTGHSNLSGPADCWLERITQPWLENSVTWNLQPATTAQNRLNVPAPTNNAQNYTLDVTALVQDMLDDPANSHGFMLRQQNESYYRSLLFASSDHVSPQLHPRLDITYTTNDFPLSGCWTSATVPPDTTASATDPVLSIPNVFSPDGDGINDEFFPDTSGIRSSSLEIFDRWGVKVCATAALRWDGYSTSGQPCSDGTYYYLLRCTMRDGKERDFKGFVMLVRS